MNTKLLEKKFKAMGARLRVREPRRRFNIGSDTYRIDISRDKEGEFFILMTGRPEAVNLDVIDVRPNLRHLLMMDRDSGAKLLCGHDERHWFVAGVPEQGVRGVQDAMNALRPKEVVRVARGLKKKHRNKRRNEAFVRQGEWFFVPTPKLDVDERIILKNEPLIRAGRRGGTPHMCQFLYRRGGRSVYLKRNNLGSVMKPLSHEEYTKMMKDPDVDQREKMGWSQQKVEMSVYVKGKITHPDHATVVLDIWHRVFMNTEGEAAFAGEKILFVD